MKYRKKPIIIEAYQTDVELDIKTLEGVMHANVGDYIITGINGEKYPCKPDIFEKTYELIGDYYEKYAEKASRCDNYVNFKSDLTLSDYPQSITVTLSPKYNKLVRDFCEFTNTPLNQFIKHAVEYYWEKIQNDIDIISKI